MTKPPYNAFLGLSRSEVVAVLFVLCVLSAGIWLFRPYHRDKALQTSCMSNEKQLGIAFAQYAQDYDNTYPCGTHSAPLRALSAGWAGQIYPYVKSTGIFQCPDDKTHTSTDISDDIRSESYAYNWNIVNTSLASNNQAALLKRPAKMSDFHNASRTVMLCEAFGTAVDLTGSHGVESVSPAVVGGNEFGAGMSVGKDSGFQYATGVMRNDAADAALVGSDNGDAMKDGVHTGGSNFLYADGHAKWLKPEWVSAGATNNIGPADCTTGQGLNPVGKAGNGYAAGTGCTDPNLKATFSID
jgi:prepilin-type processing-associated H-X9-DG protein